jgi:excisionase family DNA binding protein
MENAYDLNSEKRETERKIMTLKEVADLLRVHRSTVSRYAKSGELRSYQIGNRRLFKSDDVWLFFENQVALECVSGKEDL